MLRAGTAWTRKYIQVHNEITGNWHTAQCSAYAISQAHFDAQYVYDPETNAPKQVGGIFHKGTVYSPYYHNDVQRQARAVEGYLNNYTLYDCTGDINFYLFNANSTDPATSRILVFTHQESTAYLLPNIQEE
jgi:hypothetical protein